MNTIKSLTLVLLMSVIMLGCNSDKKDEVPQNVLDVFAEQYPEATGQRWSLKEDAYEVDFIFEGEEMEVEYDLDGKLDEVEFIMDPNKLPQPIIDYINEHYKFLFIEEASLEIKGLDTLYEVEMKKPTFKTRELEFDTDGNMVSDDFFKK